MEFTQVQNSTVTVVTRCCPFEHKSWLHRSMAKMAHVGRKSGGSINLTEP